YLSPAPGQPGNTSDLYYTFTPVLAPPALSSVAAGTGAGTLTPGTTYYYVVTAVTAEGGETIAGKELIFRPTANQLVTLSWRPVAGAVSYNVYRGTATGAENILVAQTTAATANDDGSSTISQSPPEFNTAFATGDYYVAISGQGNSTYDPTTNNSGLLPGSTGYYQVTLSVGHIDLRGTNLIQGDPGVSTFVPFVDNSQIPPENHVSLGTLIYGSPDTNPFDPSFGVEDTTVRVIKYDYQGDTQPATPQGEIIIESNTITNSLNDGVLATSAPRESLPGQSNPNLPHPGSVRNLPTLNNANLVAGAVMFNNIVSGFNNAGIEFDGDNSGQPSAPVPFGRIMNNTIYGGTQPSGTGILVQNNASPTIINNIVANTKVGISVDNSSQQLASAPVLASNLYQGNGTDSNDPGGAVGTNSNLSATGKPLFVNAAANNFYLAAFSPAINSSVSVVQDRAAVIAVTSTIGIPPSPILAPAYDINGQLRGPEPNGQSTGGGGQGSNTFIDRGAEQRVEVTGPIASLLQPSPSSAANQSSVPNTVQPIGQIFSEFDILLSDGIGSGVDDTTVTTNQLHVYRNGVLLVAGVDYSFVYDNNNHIIRLLAASGVWQNGNVYDLFLNNGTKFDPNQNGGSPATGSTGIANRAGISLQADSPTGFSSFRIVLEDSFNDPPAVVVPTQAQQMYEHTTLAFSPLAPPATNAAVLTTVPNGITIFDVDANGGVEQVTLTASVGQLTLVDPRTGQPLIDANGNALPGDPFPDVIYRGLGTAADPLVIRGPLGDLTTNEGLLNDLTAGQLPSATFQNPGINTALAGLVYELNNRADTAAYYFNGNASITVVANDLGNTPPPAKITTVTIPVTVIAVNNPPADSVPSSTSSFMDFPAASAAANGLTFRVVDNSTAPATTSDYKLGIGSEVSINSTATGASVAGQTISVTRGGVTKIFEFTLTGSVAQGHVAIRVNSTDTATVLASTAAGIISGSTGFNVKGLATAPASNAAELLITAPTSVSGSQLTLSNNNWEVDVAQIATGANISHQTITLNSTTFEFTVPSWQIQLANNATGSGIAHETISVSVTQNGTTTSKTFELITATSGAAATGNIAVLLNNTDGPVQIAADIAAAIDGASGFNNSTLATAAGEFVTVGTANPITTTGTLLLVNDIGATAPGNVPIAVSNTDGPALLASEAAAAINANSNTPGLVVANASELIFRSPPTLGEQSNATSGPLLTLFNPVPFSATDSAAQIAQDVALAIGLPATAAAGNRLTLPANDQFVALQASEDVAYTFSTAAGNAVTVSDPDVSTTAASSTGPFEEIVSVLSGAGVLQINHTSGITFLNATANGQTILDFEGTLAAINEALDGLQFIPADEFVGPVQIAFFTNDHGNTGVGPAPTFAPAPVPLFSQEQDVRLETLTATDAPTIDTTKTLSLTSINETPSSPPVPAVPAPNPGQSVYSLLTNAGTILPAMTLTATGAKYGIAITGATIVGQPAGAPGGVWEYSLDGGNTWLIMSGLAANNALLLDGGNGTSSFGDLVRFLPDANFNSSDGTPTITFNGWDQTAGLNPNSNVLLNLVPGGFADLSATGVGAGGSTPFSAQSTTATIKVNAVNDRPTVTAPTTTYTTKEDTALPLAGISVSDFEFSQNNGTVKVTVALSDSTTGTLSATVFAGLSGNNTASLTLQGTLAVVNQALATLVFTPALNFAGSTQVNIQATDLDTSGLPVDGTGASIRQVSATVGISILVTTVHQAPVLYPTGDGVPPVTGNPALTAVAENASSSTNLGTSVQNLLASFGPNSVYQDGKPPVSAVPQPAPFLDLDADAGAKQGIAIDAVATQGGGVWQYSVNGGSSWVPIATAADNNALVLPGTALVRFQPNQNYVSTPGNLPSLTFRAWDQTDGASTASRVNLTPITKIGGTTAYSAATATATVTVAAQNQPPSFAISSGYTTFMDNTVPASSSQHGRNNLPISVANFVFAVSPGLQGENVTFNVTNDEPSLFSAQPTITLDPSGTTGTLHFTLAPSQFGIATLTVTATNSGGGNNTSAPQKATITVIGITDPPTIDPILNQQVANNAGAQQVALTGITPGLDETQVMSVTATSNNTALVPNPTISYTNPSTTGTLFYTPTAGLTGTATITVTVTNNGGTAFGGVNTVSETFTITVGSGIPTANAASVSVAENGQQAITLTGSPATNQSGALSATIATLPTGGTLYQTSNGVTLGAAITAPNTAVTNSQNVVIYVPNSNQTGNDSFTFTMTGGTPAQTSLPATISLNIVAPSQLPSFTPGPNVQVGINAGAQTIVGWATNISSGTNPSGQPLAFELTGDTSPSLFSAAPAINASNGTLSFTPAANATGSATITFVLKDTGNGQLSAPHSFNININAVPVAQPDTYVLSTSGTNTVPASNGVLSNDSAG
ncbi:MAG TPA: hypothetical protein VG125_33405, partial [Pirellulales bacterium]|nr:hypothetical protein [Pirellulales bacterium]